MNDKPDLTSRRKPSRKPDRMNHDFITRTATEVADQTVRPVERRAYPPQVIKLMMLNETAASPTSPRVRCIRCSDMLLQKFVVLIVLPWPHEPDYVCRICYDSKRDRRLPRNTRAR